MIRAFVFFSRIHRLEWRWKRNGQVYISHLIKEMKEKSREIQSVMKTNKACDRIDRINIAKKRKRHVIEEWEIYWTLELSRRSAIIQISNNTKGLSRIKNSIFHGNQRFPWRAEWCNFSSKSTFAMKRYGYLQL